MLVLFVALQLLAVLNPEVVEVDPEEGYNAGHALALASGHWDALFALQYRPFCGGCTLNAAMGAPLFMGLGAQWWVWKLVPISFSALLLLVGFVRLPTPSRWLWALLFLLPSHTWLMLSLIGWGNHYEAGCLAAIGLLLLRTPQRPLLSGLVLGMAVWVGFSGLFALPAAMLWQLRRDRGALLRLMLGAALGMSPWLGQWWLADATAFGEIYGQGEALPSLHHLPAQLWTLLHPRQLAGLLGHPWLGMGGLLAIPSAVAGLILLRRHDWGALLGLAALSWLGIYLLSGFHIPVPPGPQLPTPASLRYMAPLLPLLMLGLAGSGGDLWKAGRPYATAALVGFPLLVGVLGRTAVLWGAFPVPQALTMRAPDLAAFRQQAGYILDRSAHRACRNPDPQERAMHGYALGYNQATTAFYGNPTPAYALMGFKPPARIDEASFYQGASVALIDHLDPDGAGELAILTEALEISSRWGADASQAMLWSRRYASWLAVIDGHDEAALLSTMTLLEGAPPELWWLVGARWSEDTSRPLVPTTLALPTITPDQAAVIPPTFSQGMAMVMGELWGPRPAPLPQNLPASWEATFQQGYVDGVQRRWP